MTSKNLNMELSNTCKNCGSENIETYCSNCGQKIYTKRFTLKNFLLVFLNAFNIEKGFLYTLKMLFIQPGIIINDYIKGKTKQYFNPLKYVLIVAGLFAFLMITTNIFDTSYKASNDALYNSSEVLKQQKNDELALQMENKMLEYVKQYMNLIPLIIIPFFSLVSMWFYRSRKLFYGEFLIVNC
ncbi:DUF3667 domain-containing protein, partial [Bacteroidota bacterium]